MHTTAVKPASLAQHLSVLRAKTEDVFVHRGGLPWSVQNGPDISQNVLSSKREPPAVQPNARNAARIHISSVHEAQTE